MKKKNKMYITVLDFEVGEVFQYEAPENKEYEEYLTNKGHNLGNCEWMVHDIAQVITKSDYRKVVFNDLF